MKTDEFELFVQTYGKDILRFCRMTTGSREAGDELYQDTMLKLLEKREKLDAGQNTKSYAVSMAIFLWKNRRKKHAVRARLTPTDSMESLCDEGTQFSDGLQENSNSPEQIMLRQDEAAEVQRMVAALPEKYRLPIHLYYAAEMQINDIAVLLHLPEGTVKSRMRKAKQLLKERLEASGYDR
ncbi:MAG: sigma-70 family RNA polymerase sigma factor [Lachnospiraceae bacterium]|nr:sigma-70 family RNA polymerase sigma factor [Lachnospiraceae bacterium]